MIARRVFSELSSRRSISILSRMMGSTRSLVLGIESSCDDSCAAIVSEDGQVLCSYQLSQEKQNQRNRGIIPAEAAKSHSKNIPLVVERTLQSVPKEIDAVALTIGPGIAPCLGEGLLFAQRFCKEIRKPLILVNHMEGHAMAATMQNDVPFPSLAFLVSGGNTESLLCENPEQPFLKLGNTLDDACGECMDKVFRCIYENQTDVFPPDTVIKHGGAQLSIWASAYEKKMREEHPSSKWIQQNRIPFPTPLSKHKTFNFSFSGIKTHSIRYIEREVRAKQFSYNEVLRFSFYFERAVIGHLIRKLEYTLQQIPSIRSMCCGGGVMSNQLLRRQLQELGTKYHIPVYIPPREVCTDNAIMIAWRGQQLLKQRRSIVSWEDVDSLRYNDRLDFDLYSM